MLPARMNSLLLTGGRVIDPANRFDAVTDLLILDGKIAALGSDAKKQAPAESERLDTKGLIVCPGLIDPHVHLREPGQGAKETIATGTAAAARGGFTSVVCMPNTSPAVDNSGTVALIRERAECEGVVNVFITGAITKGIAGEELAPIGSLKRAGVVAITDDGHCVQNNELMRRALEYAGMFHLPVMDHCPVLPRWPAYDTNLKMNPPLRSAKDREAILEGIVDGTLEVLGSDHAPHCDYEKEVEFDYAPFGITGLETELALSLMQLYHTNRLGLSDLIAKFTVAPARLLRLDKGTLSIGADADVTVFDPNREWVFGKEQTASKSLNSPFYGWRLKGKALATIVNGKTVWREQN